MKSFLLASVILCLGAGVTFGQQQEESVVQLSDPVKETDEYRVFGSQFNQQTPVMMLDSLIAKPESFDEQTVATKGIIKQVCQKKGCFFMLESENGQQARISFKDYSFFIPSNTAGDAVKLEGVFQVKTITEEDAKHYAKDAGQNPDAIRGPQNEYAIIATSVMIYK